VFVPEKVDPDGLFPDERKKYEETGEAPKRPDDELHAHDRRLPKYFLTGGAFLLLGGMHMVLKNLPWTAEWLARAGYAGHLVRDLSNTHVMIVGGGTLISTGLCWYVLPRIVRRPLVSPGLAQGSFWFTAVGLLVFYVALIANGIAMGRLVSNGWDYEAAKLHMGKAYRVPTRTGSIVELNANLKKSVTVDELKNAFRTAASKAPLQGVMDVLEEEWTSSRIVGDSHSSIIDLPLMQVMGDKFVSVAAWYDNEWGFTSRLAETAALLVKEAAPVAK